MLSWHRSPRHLETLFFALTGVEGLAVALWLARGRPGWRLALVGGLFLVALLCLGLARRAWMTRAADHLFIVKVLEQPALAITLSVAAALISVAVVFLEISPAGGRFGAYLRRWSPIDYWLFLAPLQFCLAIWLAGGLEYWTPIYKKIATAFLRFFARLDSPIGGLILVGLALWIGWTQIGFGRFVDEADNLAIGWLMARGAQLYRDTFSHHFPLPYYWVAAVVNLFGNSREIVRVSLYLLQAGLLLATLRLTRFYLPIGLAAIFWASTRIFFWGYQVLYHSFSATFILAAFLVLFALYVRQEKPDLLRQLFIGAMCGLAILSDPLMVYPAAIILFSLCLRAALSAPGRRWQSSLRCGLWAGGAAAVILLIFVVYTAAVGAWSFFVREAIQFNTQVYDRYTEGSPNRLFVLVKQLASGLHILAADWRVNLTLAPIFSFDKYNLDTRYFQWIFSSFFYRFAFLTLTFGLFYRGLPGAAVLVYLFSASLLIRAETGIQATGFILLGEFAAVFSLTGLRATRRQPEKSVTNSAKAAWGRFFGILLAGFQSILALMVVWSLFYGLNFLHENRAVLRDKYLEREYLDIGERVRQFACGRQDVQLLFYPLDPLVYFYTQIPPAARYSFMLPWVADVGQQAVIAELEGNPAAVVFIDEGFKILPRYVAREWLADLIDYLNTSYQKIDDGWWASPGLATCNKQLSP